MAYFYINTDWETRDDAITCDLWFEYEMAFAGDYENNKWEHSTLFKKLKIGDILFMYQSKKDKKNHNKKGFVGVGIVTKEWDKKCYELSERLLYRKELYEYRISVDWYADWRSKPKSSFDTGLPVTPNYWCSLDETRYKVKELADSAINK